MTVFFFLENFGGGLATSFLLLLLLGVVEVTKGLVGVIKEPRVIKDLMALMS